MTVTGTQQRVYGTLTGGCIIDLHRFALVSGSTTQSPTEASTITYADTTPYKQCGYKYAGYLTLFLSISGSSVYAAVEVRICKNDAKRIVIETYGEVAKTVTGGMSLWFNKGTDKHFPTRDDFPETGSSNVNYINDATGKYYIWNETLYEEGSCWVKLNSTTSGVIMPYATTSYTFKESKRNGSTTIDCCKKCPSCGCKACSVQFYVMLRGTSTKIYPSTTLMYGYHSPPYGNQSCLWNISTVPVMTVADWRCTEVDVNVPANAIYDVYFEDPDGDDPLIGTFEWFRSDGNYEIVVEYTIECDDIKVWAYTLVDEDNWQLSNLIGRSIRINYACATSTYIRGTIASISGSSGIVTISIPDVTVDAISNKTGGTCIPSTDFTMTPEIVSGDVNFYTFTGYLPFMSIPKFYFHITGLVPQREYARDGGLSSFNEWITTFRVNLHSGLMTDTGGMPSWSLDLVTTGWRTSYYNDWGIKTHQWREMDGIIEYNNPFYKTTSICDSWSALKIYCELECSLNSGSAHTFTLYEDGVLIPITPAWMKVEFSIDGANPERCMTGIRIGNTVYID